MLRKYCMGQKLRTIFKPEYLPSALEPLLDDYDDQFLANIRGTLLNDTLAFDERFRQQQETMHWRKRDEAPLSPSDYNLLKAWLEKYDINSRSANISARAFHRTQIHRLGETFQTESVSDVESQVYFSREDGQGRAPGSIETIFSHTRSQSDGSTHTQTFFIVKQYTPLTPDHVDLDHYRDFPIVSGQVYYTSLHPKRIILSSDQLLYHFAPSNLDLPGVDEPCIVPIPLDRS